MLDAEVRVPCPAWSDGLRHSARLFWRGRNRARPQWRSADSNIGRRTTRLRASGLSRDRRRPGARPEPLRAEAIAERRSLEYGFVVEQSYRQDHDLIIDPGLDYSAFLGGSSHEVGAAIAVDASGNAYVTGFTQSPNFPTTVGAFAQIGLRQQLPGCVCHQIELDRNLAHQFHVSRRKQLRMGTRHRNRHSGQRICGWSDEILGFPDHWWRFRPDLQCRHLPALRHRPGRCLRRQVEPRRFGPRVLHVPWWLQFR